MTLRERWDDAWKKAEMYKRDFNDTLSCVHWRQRARRLEQKMRDKGMTFEPHKYDPMR